MHKNKRRKHIYPRIKAQFPKQCEQLYREHKQEFESWSEEERKRRGFKNHCHPRRFFIFLDRYHVEINYFMSDKERSEYVFPWVCATRSERMAALKKSKLYLAIKKQTLKCAQKNYTIYKLNKQMDEYRK